MSFFQKEGTTVNSQLRNAISRLNQAKSCGYLVHVDHDDHLWDLWAALWSIADSGKATGQDRIRLHRELKALTEKQDGGKSKLEQLVEAYQSSSAPFMIPLLKTLVFFGCVIAFEEVVLAVLLVSGGKGFVTISNQAGVFIEAGVCALLWIAYELYQWHELKQAMPKLAKYGTDWRLDASDPQGKGTPCLLEDIAPNCSV